MSLYFFDLGLDVLADGSSESVESRLERSWDISYEVDSGLSDCIGDGINSSPINTSEINSCFSSDAPATKIEFHLNSTYVLNDTYLYLAQNTFRLYDVTPVTPFLTESWHLRYFERNAEQEYSLDSSGPNLRTIHLGQEYNVVSPEFVLELLGYVNEHRAKLGLQAIAPGWDTASTDIATIHSKNSAAVEISAHDSLEYPEGWQFFISDRLALLQLEMGVSYGGENVQTQVSSPAYVASGAPQVDFKPITAYDVFLQWKNSPGHNAVMLHPWADDARPTMLFGLVTTNDSAQPVFIREYATQVFLAFNAPGDKVMNIIKLPIEWTLNAANINFLAQTYELDAVVRVSSAVEFKYEDEITAAVEFKYEVEVEQQITFQYGDILNNALTFQYDLGSAVETDVTFSYDILQYEEVSQQLTFNYSDLLESALEFQYDDVTEISASLTFLYDDTVQVSKALEFQYDDTVQVSKALGFLYDDVVQVSRSLTFVYDDTTEVSQELSFTYDLNDQVHSFINFKYDSVGEISGELGFKYDILTVDEVSSSLRFIYNLLPYDLGLSQSMLEMYVTVGGVTLVPKEVLISTSEDDLLYQVRLEFYDTEDYSYFREGVIFEVYLFEETYTFQYNDTTIERDVPNVRIIIEGLSPGMVLKEGRAETQSYDYTTHSDMQTIIEDILGESVTWNLPSWPVPPYRVSAENTTPLDFVSTLLKSAGALIESNLDGTFNVRPVDPIQPNKYKDVTPDFVLDDVLHNLSISQRIEYQKGYNNFLITEGDSQFEDVIEWVPDEGFELQGALNIYPSPWRLNIALGHTSESPDVFLGNAQWKTRQEEELIEFKSGQASTRYPIETLTSIAWHSKSLGGILFESYSKNLSTGITVNEGYGVAVISYTTRFFEYRTSVPSANYIVQYVLKDLT